MLDGSPLCVLSKCRSTRDFSRILKFAVACVMHVFVVEHSIPFDVSTRSPFRKRSYQFSTSRPL